MQAAQVIETKLSRYGTITTDLPAAPASVAAGCARFICGHSSLPWRLLGFYPFGLSRVASPHAQPRPRTAPASRSICVAENIIKRSTTAWSARLARMVKAERAPPDSVYFFVFNTLYHYISEHGTLVNTLH